MSVTAAIRKMLDKGLTIEQALIAAEAFESEPPQLTARQARNKRYYDNHRRLNASYSDASDASDVSDDIPPLPLKKKNPPTPPLKKKQPHPPHIRLLVRARAISNNSGPSIRTRSASAKRLMRSAAPGSVPTSKPSWPVFIATSRKPMTARGATRQHG
jgi:hypothetical protein